MPRTNATDVQATLGDDYGPRADGTLPDLNLLIGDANVLVNRLVVMAAAKPTAIVMDAGTLESIERWLACHLYVQSDQAYTQRSTGQGASASFQSTKGGEGFASTNYGRTAMDLDWSHCLKNLNKQQRVSAAWLGKPRSSQVPLADRD